MEGKGFTMNFFVKRMSVNQAIFLEMLKDFNDFITSSILFLFQVISILLNVVNAVDLVDTLKKNSTGVRLLAFGSILHSINFTSKKASNFISAGTATNSGDSFGSFCGGNELDRSSRNLSFSFGVLIKDRGIENFPDVRKRFFFSKFLFVADIGDIECNITDNAKIKESADVSSLKIFVNFAFRIEGSISTEATPNIESFRVIGEDRNPKPRNFDIPNPA